MIINYLLVTLALLGLLIFRLVLDANGKASTRMLAVALIVGIMRFGTQTLLVLIDSDLVVNSALIVSDTLYVLFFLLLAMHFTSRHLPVMGYWLPQLLICLAILFTDTLILFVEGFDTASFNELIRTLLFLTSTLAFVTIARSPEMLNNQPVFWIPTLIVATGFGITTVGKLASTILHFAGNGSAGLLAAISSSLGIVATLLLLIFLAANISWFKNSI